jgi:hypothetical protein
VKAQTIFAVGATVVVAAVIAVGLFLNGNPAEVRRQRLDEQRISDLNALSSAVDATLQSGGALPASLAELGRDRRWTFLRDRDPVTGEPYEYRTTGARSYELCATFDTSSSPGAARLAPVGFLALGIPATPRSQDAAGFWDHGPGRHCFMFTAAAVPQSPR